MPDTNTNGLTIDPYAVVFVTCTLPFSNWSAHRIEIWGKTFATIEHAYQYKKFIETDVAWAERIREAASPIEAKRLGWLRKIDVLQWDSKRLAIMRDLLMAKTAQHAEVRKALIMSQSRVIIENDDQQDTFWGVGASYTGQNNLGKIWMDLRRKLISKQ